MNDELSKVAIVTGGSRGIGLAISKELARTGIGRIVVCDIDDEEGRLASEELQKDFGIQSDFIRMDVSNEQEVVAAFSKIWDEAGRLDVLVNNAGVVDDAFLEKLDLEKWNRVIGVSLTGTFNCTKQAIGLMKRNEGGRILNLASVSAEIGNIGQANYVAAKGGIIAFTKTAARECARYGILVNAIAPGFVRTRMTASIRPDITEKIVSQIPLRRYAEPEEIARLARFLVSEENTYITGQTVNINGGLYV
ncbi:MAG: 3-oxoacyl-ACP reductase FabG [Candidatus Thermoplasmatota archaeon]|nr:3-oxoacyl-ACP reductase FabG [Candidatus Thermoplasmatota archaeon]